MAIRKETILINNVKHANTQIQKVISNINKVWENWVYREGYLNYSSTTYNACFDRNQDTQWETNNPNETGWADMRAWFPKPTKIREMKVCGGSGGPAEDQGSFLKIIGLRVDGGEDELLVHRVHNIFYPNEAWRTYTLSSETDYIGVKVERTGGGQGWYRVREVQVTKWIQKGQ